MIHSRLPSAPDGCTTIGLVADTHCHAGRISLPDAVLEAFRGADLILHLGDMGEAAVLDRLAHVAPVLATRGGDDPAEEPRIADEGRILAGSDLTLAAAFELGQLIPGAKSEGDLLPAERIDSALRARAGCDVHAVVYAATHSPALFVRDGVLFVNPGSATLPATRGPSGLGTVARVSLRERSAHAELIQL
jgi:putative phosphoesterase